MSTSIFLITRNPRSFAINYLCRLITRPSGLVESGVCPPPISKQKTIDVIIGTIYIIDGVLCRRFYYSSLTIIKKIFTFCPRDMVYKFVWCIQNTHLARQIKKIFFFFNIFASFFQKICRTFVI